MKKIPWAMPNITKEDIDYVKEILDSGWYTMGEQVKLLEKKMAGYVGRKHAIAVNNGTAALEVLLRSINIGHGDEVIVPATSFIASASAVSLVGAQPVFIDVDNNMTIDPNHIDAAVTKKTKAVMAVDLTGSPCDYDLLLQKCNKYNVDLIVDGAQSLGSTYKNRSCLSYGLMSTTSFHAAKIITTVEGGMVFTDDDELAKKARAIRAHGETDTKFIHNCLGGNYRMTDILAGFAIKQLDRYDATLKNRSRLVDYYKKLLPNVDVLTIRKEGKTCNFMFLILCEDIVVKIKGSSNYTPSKRNILAEFLKKKGIETRKVFPLTMPQQPLYNIKESFFPLAEWFCKNSLSLPLYNSLQKDDIGHICEMIKEAL